MDIFSLTYVSSASGLYDKDIYRNIALQSRAHNEARSITGMLLVYNETIIQILEGYEQEVRGIYARIEQDKRHKSPIVISTRKLPTREFPDWSMGYKEMVEMNDPGFLFYLNHRSLQLHVPQNISSVSNSLIQSFARGSGLQAA